MKTKHERKSLKRERQSMVKRTLTKGKSHKGTGRNVEEFFGSYYGFLCDRELCFGV